VLAHPGDHDRRRDGPLQHLRVANPTLAELSVGRRGAARAVREVAWRRRCTRGAVVTSWAFSVLGSPAPQGSKKYLGQSRAGHAILGESSKKVMPWREAVKAAAPPGPMLDGPIAVRIVFTLQRPKSARKSETRPYRYPDCSKILRSTEDAITEAGLWRDDALVAEFTRLAKVWPGFDTDALHVPGVVVAAVEMSWDWEAELAEAFAKALAERQVV
jgi:Holliday junction resolvase RusA-like endonuclease